VSVDGFEFYGCHAAESLLAAASVVGPFDPGDDRDAQPFAGVPALSVEDVLLQQCDREDSMAALSPAAPTRPMEPRMPCRFSAVTKRLERNCDPRSE